MNEIKKESLIKLREQLAQHRGSINEIANRHKCSREWVRNVLHGEWPDTELVLLAAKVLEERKNKKLSHIKAINSLIL